jgi:crotonobetainyl-CoA:carnitine CoA-transferase CaiB-like acyl-CoA transferase
MAEILARLDRDNVPAAPILSRTELLDDQQIALNGALAIIRHKTIGEVRQPRPAARFDATPATALRIAPFLGKHNTVILEETRLPEIGSGQARVQQRTSRTESCVNGKKENQNADARTCFRE